jgi:hypothetical protein
MKAEQVERMIEAVERLGTGRTSGAGCAPTGFEAVTMALCGMGTPGKDSVAAGLHDIAGALREVAEAMQEQGR